jgi:hypothetical protein
MHYPSIRSYHHPKGLLTIELFSIRFIDPIFGVGVGISAAIVRIRREQNEKYPEQDNGIPALAQKARLMAGNAYERFVNGEQPRA